MLKSLHKLRGLAALAVAVSHIAHWREAQNTAWEMILIACGAQAVPVFFVISGFIIARSHRKEVGRFNCIGDYTIKRTLRIYPLYWFYSAVFLLLGVLGFHSIDPANTLTRNFPQTLCAIFLFPATTASLGYVGATWSLVYEVLFYLVFAFFFLGRKSGIAAMSLLIGISVINHHFWLTQQFCFNHMNLLFLMGVLLGFWSDNIPRLRIPSTLALSFGTLLFTISLWIRPQVNYPILYPAAFLLVAGAVIRDFENRDRPKATVSWFEKTLLWLGSISYSLYLGHMAVQTILYKFAGSPYGSPVVAVLYILCPIGVASLTYLWIEYPLQKLAGRLTHRELGRLPNVSPVVAHTP
jgi:peptidoglycan/LPS O-acetylase OafA/YrhL